LFLDSLRAGGAFSIFHYQEEAVMPVSKNRRKNEPKKKTKKKGKENAPDFEELTIKNPNAAGIDLASKGHFVAVPADRDEQSVREFGCYSDDIRDVGKWLKECKVETIAMEATGVYWIPVMEILEGEFGFEVILVQPRYAKNVPGKKSDVKDCQWIMTLHAYGLLPASFRPSQEICRLRKYWRHRERLVDDASQQVLRIQKELEQMNVHLHKVVSDVTGVSGMRILKAILAGERDPQKLAELRHQSVEKPEEEIVRALSGNYRQEHVDILNDVLETYEHIHRQLARVSDLTESCLSQFASKVEPDEVPLPKSNKRPQSRKKNQPHFDVRTEVYRITGIDLTQIPCLSSCTILTLISECGMDMTKWKTEKHFANWLGLAPGLNKTGGKNRNARTAKVKNRAADALRIAAMSLARTDTALGANYRRLRARLGPRKANTAMARKLAIIFYNAMKYEQIYDDLGAEHYEKQYREKTVKFLKSKAKNNGLQIIDPKNLTERDLQELLVAVQIAKDEREANCAQTGQ